MTDWHAAVEAARATLDEDQADALHASLPGYAVLAHDARRGRLSLRFSVQAPTLRQAAAEALGAARRACAAAFTPAPELTQIRVLSAAEHAQELDRPPEQDLVGYTEISHMFDVSRQRAREIAETHAGFPPPVARPAAGPVYTRASVTAFLKRWPRRRTGRPPKSGPPPSVGIGQSGRGDLAERAEELLTETGSGQSGSKRP